MRRLPKLRHRARMLEQKYAESGRRIFSSGRWGLLCWVNLTLWTYDPRQRQTNLPFFTFPVQSRVLMSLHDAMTEGYDILIEKSRDMGATWLNIAALVWFWLFYDRAALLMVSRKEGYVDSSQNPDTLFWKAQYLVDTMPKWLRPDYVHTIMHLQNCHTLSVINGESTNDNVSRGGRRRAILLDEFAACDRGRQILASTTDATDCRIFNSTPRGMGNAFADIRHARKIKIIRMHWSQHPIKGLGKTLIVREGKPQWTSPWYRAQCQRRTDRLEIAQELNIDYINSSSPFFEQSIIMPLLTGGRLRDPDFRGDIAYDMARPIPGASPRITNARFRPRDKGRFEVWMHLADNMPPADHYVLFADISHGAGMSNSVITVATVRNCEVVATYVSPHAAPHEMARIAAAIATWLRGKTWPMIGWEFNGAGAIFGKELKRLNYPNLYIEGKDAVPGWHSTRHSKQVLLGDLRRALARGELILHDRPTVMEAQDYQWYKNGGVGPSHLAEEPEAKAPHGDRVIATAGLLLCLEKTPLINMPRLPEIADDSYAARQITDRESRKHKSDALWN